MYFILFLSFRDSHSHYICGCHGHSGHSLNDCRLLCLEILPWHNEKEAKGILEAMILIMHGHSQLSIYLYYTLCILMSYSIHRHWNHWGPIIMVHPKYFKLEVFWCIFYCVCPHYRTSCIFGIIS